MPTITEQLRDKLHNRIGIDTHVKKWSDTDAMHGEVKSKCDALDTMVKLAKDRLLMGAIRYGKAADYSFDEYMRKLNTKLDHYARTGNAEMLVDAINYCMLMFHTKVHTDHHFNALDDEVH